MHGMADIIIIVMAEERIKKVLQYIDANRGKLIKYFHIAMIAIIVIIAIILIDIISVKDKNDANFQNTSTYDASNISFRVCDKHEIYKFITDYFGARVALNFPKIFSSYGRDYYSERRDDTTGKIKKIEDSIRYEKTFVRDYTNVKVYINDGFNGEDVVCVVTYDLLLGFSDGAAPMIMIFYLTKKDETYMIKDDLDVGTSKYLLDCVNTKTIKDMYNETRASLVRALTGNENLKMAYNSLRQYEMNMGGNINYDKNKLIDNFGIEKLDPVNDADYIYNFIVNKKNEDKTKKELDEYIDRIVASMSDVTIEVINDEN